MDGRLFLSFLRINRRLLPAKRGESRRFKCHELSMEYTQRPGTFLLMFNRLNGICQIERVGQIERRIVDTKIISTLTEKYVATRGVS